MIPEDDPIGARRAGLLCPVAGLAIALSLPPWGWWPLALVGVALLDRLLAGQPTQVRFVRGAIVAAVWTFVATLWAWDFSIAGYLILVAFVSLVYGAACALVPPSGRARNLGLAGALVLAALVRWNWPWGGAPLATLAMSQSDGPLGQTARVFGSLFIVLLVGIGGVALSALASRRLRDGLLGIGLVVACWLVALVAPSGTPFAELDVAVVQGGGPQNTRAANTNARDVFDRHMAASEEIATPVDLVLWPEDVVHSRGPIGPTDEYAELAELASRVDAPVVAGIIESFRDEGYFLNASIVITPEGETISRYDKVRRVPFGEWVPFRSIVEIFAPAYLPRYNARPGTGPAVITVDGEPMAISISWEVFHDDRAREGVREGGSLLLNPTNGSSFWLTIVQSQQIASSKLRAIENGRWVLQAAPTGFSGIIRPDGTIVERSDVSEARVIHGTVELRSGQTLATRLGDWPMILIALVLVAVSRPPQLRAGSAEAVRARLPARRTVRPRSTT